MKIKRPMGVLCFVFILIVFLCLEISGGIKLNDYDNEGELIYIEGVIEDIVYKNHQYSLRIRDASIICLDAMSNTVTGRKSDGERTNGIGVIAYMEDNIANLHIGQRVRIKGKYKGFSVPENEGQFNLKKYYRIQGYDFSMTKAEVIAASKTFSYVKDFLYRRKEAAKALYFRYMTDIDAGTLSAMVLGDKSGLDPYVKELYQSAGISHILSLSGLHIATLGLFLFSLLVKTGFGTAISSVISSFIIIFYGIMTGMSTSTSRALIMFILGIVAKNIGRTYDLLSATYLSAIFILMENPYLVYDSGFLLSFSAVFGIGVVFPTLDRVFSFRREVNNRIDKTRQGILISISVTVSTFPVVMNSFYKISVFSILANIVVVPLMSVVLGLGILACVLGKFTFIPSMALKLAAVILDLYSVISNCVSAGNIGTWVVGKGNIIQISVYIILICLLPLVMQKTFRKINSVDSENTNIYKERFRYRISKMCLLRCMVTIYILTAIVIITVRIRPEYSINVLSVGQGACNVIYGKNVPVIMIDAGSVDVKEVYKYRIEPFLLSKGIGEIDYLFITHPDEDHISGVMEMIGDDNSNVKTAIKVKNLVMSLEDAKIRQSGFTNRQLIMRKGDRISKGDLSIECLSPGNLGNVEWKDIEANDASLVLKVLYKPTGYIALFTGDISSKVEEKIISEQKEKLGGGVDFMTIAHHGSRFSSCEDFLRVTSPAICTISSGKGNSYGHPHEETLERLNECTPKTKVLRTDECGQVKVKVDRDEVQINRFIDVNCNMGPNTGR